MSGSQRSVPDQISVPEQHGEQAVVHHCQPRSSPGGGPHSRPSSNAAKSDPNPASPEFLRRLIDDLGDGVYAVDTKRSILFWNAAAQRLTGYEAAEVLGRSCADHILVHVDVHGNELCRTACPMKAAIEDGASRQTLAFFKHRDGHRVPVSVKVSPLHDANANRIGAVQTFSDNPDQMHRVYRQQERLRYSTIDELTGLANRHLGRLLLEETLQLSKVRSESAALLFADIDQFEELNAVYGHSVGDRVLRMLATTLRNSLRKDDVVARWGGEEFVAILPGIGMAEAVSLAERCRSIVHASAFERGGRAIRATMSFGVAMLSRIDSPESWLERARSCATDAKHRGCDRVVAQQAGPMEHRLVEP